MDLDQNSLERWLANGYKAAKPEPTLSPKGVWPKEKSQAEFTSWAVAFFLEATKELCAGSSLNLQTAVGAKSQPAITTAIKSGVVRKRVPRQSLLDFSVINEKASEQIQLTAESECDTQQPVHRELSGSSEYAWDFYKLLVVPSPYRLFFACVGTGKVNGGPIASDRRRELLVSLRSLYESHSAAFMRPTDQLGGFIIAPGGKERMDSHFFSAQRGVFRYGSVSSSLVIS